MQTQNIVTCRIKLSSHELGQVYEVMVESLLGPALSRSVVIKLNVIFGKSGSVDDTLGRTARITQRISPFITLDIRFLDSQSFSQMFVGLFKEYFK